MTAVAAALAGLAPKGRVDVVGVAAEHVEQRALARGLLVRDGGFDQVPRAVQLMAIAQVAPAFARLDQNVMRVQVAVGLLQACEPGDQVVEPRVERRIVLGGQ